jgi:hypothetical protein
MYTL